MIKKKKRSKSRNSIYRTKWTKNGKYAIRYRRDNNQAYIKSDKYEV